MKNKKIKFLYSKLIGNLDLQDKWSGSVVCPDDFTWYAVAVFERDCSKSEPYVNKLEGIWQHFDAIRETISRRFSLSFY